MPYPGDTLLEQSPANWPVFFSVARLARVYCCVLMFLMFWEE